MSEPFELALALFGHGWIDLAPHRWDAERAELGTVIAIRGRALDVSVRATRSGLAAHVAGARDASDLREVKRALATMLRLEDDLTEFWSLCRREPRLAWVSRRGAGRLMRSPTLFEDFTKLLCTTNCSWAATRNMVARMTETLGARAPSGARAFPSAEPCARQNERFFRETVRMGYRAPFLGELSRGFADGRLRDEQFEDPSLPTDEVRRRLLALPGFGPYAAGQALRLLGRYDDLALDSWCRAELAKRTRSGRAPSDRSVARAYARFGRYRGLALWMDLTARWHGEEQAADSMPLAVSPKR